MFGELIGLWCADLWRRLDAPARVLLVEFGPGRGTLMADALRAARTLPAFAAALEVHLVEISPRLQALQAERLAGHDVHWHTRLEDIPEAPLLIIANEFFDALPIRQFERRDDGWHERLVKSNGDGFEFILSPSRFEAAPAEPAFGAAPLGALMEQAPARSAAIRGMAERVSRLGGGVLIIDYGHMKSAPGDTLQAVRHHAYHGVLATPGSADITAHVDFEALARAARGAGAEVWGPVTQALFLRRLGLETRAVEA